MKTVFRQTLVGYSVLLILSNVQTCTNIYTTFCISRRLKFMDQPDQQLPPFSNRNHLDQIRMDLQTQVHQIFSIAFTQLLVDASEDVQPTSIRLAVTLKPWLPILGHHSCS